MVRIEGGDQVIEEIGEERSAVLIALVFFAAFGFCLGGVVGYFVCKFWG